MKFGALILGKKKCFPYLQLFSISSFPDSDNGEEEESDDDDDGGDGVAGGEDNDDDDDDEDEFVNSKLAAKIKGRVDGGKLPPPPTPMKKKEQL